METLSALIGLLLLVAFFLLVYYVYEIKKVLTLKGELYFRTEYNKHIITGNTADALHFLRELFWLELKTIKATKSPNDRSQEFNRIRENYTKKFNDLRAEIPVEPNWEDVY